MITLRNSVEIEQNGSLAASNPTKNNETRYVVRTSFDHWAQGEVAFAWEPSSEGSVETYLKQIAPARTFAFRHEIEMLIAAGLAKGGSLDNALIITPPNEFSTPLRLPAEWGCHKLLDAIGDLALLDARPAKPLYFDDSHRASSQRCARTKNFAGERYELRAGY